MSFYRMVLAALCCCGVLGAAPAYTVAGIVNAANYTPGPFAPNSILTLFGTNLSRSTGATTVDTINGAHLPVELDYTRVYVDNIPAPLFYVSEGQINFLLPSDQAVGSAKIRVVTQSLSGPDVTVAIAPAAPALFTTPGGYAIATHANNSLVNADSPAHGGEIIVIYATGLGKTLPNPDTGEIAPSAALLTALGSLQIALDGVPLDTILIKYAGITPGSAGLYQINLEVPKNTGIDPELSVTVAGHSCAPGLKLAIR